MKIDWSKVKEGITLQDVLKEENKELKQEIERLNNIIEEYKNANEYHQKIIHELETMKQPNQLHSENVKLRAENNRLNNIIKKVEECIDHYAIENEDFSKFYNNEEIEILKIIGSDKE